MEIPSTLARPQNHLAALAMLVAPSAVGGQFNPSYDSNVNRSGNQFAGSLYPHPSKENIFVLDSASVIAASSNPARVPIQDEDFWQFWQRSNVSGRESAAALDEITNIARLFHEMMHHRIARGATDNGNSLSWFDFENVVSHPEVDDKDAHYDYTERIEYLKRVGLDENIQIDKESEKEFLAFVSNTTTNIRAMLALLDEGHLRAVWKTDDDQIALEFLGGGTINYDIVRERSYGSCSIKDAEDILKHFLDNSHNAHEKDA